MRSVLCLLARDRRARTDRCGAAHRRLGKRGLLSGKHSCDVLNFFFFFFLFFFFFFFFLLGSFTNFNRQSHLKIHGDVSPEYGGNVGQCRHRVRAARLHPRRPASRSSSSASPALKSSNSSSRFNNVISAKRQTVLRPNTSAPAAQAWRAAQKSQFAHKLERAPRPAPRAARRTDWTHRS
jgi:hypothetical protein